MIPSLAVHLKESDYEWTAVSVTPVEKPHTEQPVSRIEQIPSAVSAETVTADDFAKRLDEYWDKVLKIPDWHAQLCEKAAAAKAARIASRRQNRKKAA